VGFITACWPGRAQSKCISTSFSSYLCVPATR